MPCISAIIFDVDGLMIDTERMGFRIFQDILVERGYTLGEEHFADMMGLDQVGCAEVAINFSGIPLDPQVLTDLYAERIHWFLTNDLAANPGLLDLLGELVRRRIPLGIASNSPVDYLAEVLTGIHADGVFQAIAGRDQVELGKPAPDLYLRAAEGLGFPPGDCLAIEDSPVGLESALAAGIRCAVVNELASDPIFDRAIARFPSLSALQAGLDSLLCS
jgi:HAD superfamily hydrolase (TIGR01509 family)